MGSSAERRLHNLQRQLATVSVVDPGLERMLASSGNTQSIWQAIPQVLPGLFAMVAFTVWQVY